MAIFTPETTFELSDLKSLSLNGLKPSVKHIKKSVTVSLKAGPTTIYSLDECNKEILVVMNVGTDEPSIFLMQGFPNFPPATLKEWSQVGDGVFFDNPDEKDVHKLFGVKMLTTPNGREYQRTIPQIIQNEKWGDPHLSSGLGRAVGTELTGSLVGTITLYEALDGKPEEGFFMVLNILNLANTEQGGLMSIYSGHQIRKSEIN